MSNPPRQPLDIELALEVLTELPEDVAVFCSTSRTTHESGRAFEKDLSDLKVRVACSRVYQCVGTKVRKTGYMKALVFVNDNPAPPRSYDGSAGWFSGIDIVEARVLSIAADAVLNRIEQLHAETTTSA